MMVYILIKVSFEESFGFYKNGSTSWLSNDQQDEFKCF